MLVFRYLAKEVFVTLVSLTTLLLLIFMSNQFVHYLNRAVSGQIPIMFVMKLMMLELPNLLGLLLPMGFYVAIIVAYGRLYVENEMTVLQASGYGPFQLLKHTYWMALPVALIVAFIALWASPYIATERAKILRNTGMQTLIKTIAPGRFREISNGRQVFYVEKMNHAHTRASDVFLARLDEKQGEPRWDVMWAEKAFVESDAQTGEDYVVLQQGTAYQGVPGNADFQTAEFLQLRIRLPHPKVTVRQDIRTRSTQSLWSKGPWDRKKAAELQWRISIPLMVLCLTLVAVPLSRVNPRSGKYAKLLPAMAVYIVYANFMFVARNWVASGKLPIWLGFWWLHLLVIGVGLILIGKTWVRR